jgi:hypothetical protein
MLTTNNPNPKVSVKVTRTMWFGGEWKQPGDVVELDYINARGIEATGKGTIMDRPQTDGEVIVAEVPTEAKAKGKAK